METKVNLNMRNCALILFLALIFTSCGKCDKVVTHENVEQTIIALERKGLDQWAKGNPSGFIVNFADDVTYFDDIAASTRIDGLEAMQNYVATTLEGNIPPHKYELVNPKVQVYGDIAILTLQYHSDVLGPNGEKAPPMEGHIGLSMERGQVARSACTLVRVVICVACIRMLQTDRRFACYVILQQNLQH